MPGPIPPPSSSHTEKPLSAPAYCTRLCQLGDCHLSDFPPAVAEDVPTTGSPLSAQTHQACTSLYPTPNKSVSLPPAAPLPDWRVWEGVRVHGYHGDARLGFVTEDSMAWCQANGTVPSRLFSLRCVSLLMEAGRQGITG
ncbi:hypothetical protein SRHO_G00021260 [Serrasalmus rhombeus]